MAVTFTQAKNTLDAIAARSDRNRRRVAQARTLLNEAASDLAAMPAAYSGFVSDLNAAAAANPSDEAWQHALSEKNHMVADFQALRTEVDALVAAIEG